VRALVLSLWVYANLAHDNGPDVSGTNLCKGIDGAYLFLRPNLFLSLLKKEFFKCVIQHSNEAQNGFYDVHYILSKEQFYELLWGNDFSFKDWQLTKKGRSYYVTQKTDIEIKN